jgi:type I restriction enzyme, S subunit
MSEWLERTLQDVAYINPTESLPKGTMAKKVAMTEIQSFTKKVAAYSVEPYNGGMKFRNGDTLVARITPCLENGKTAYVDILDGGEVGFGSTEYIVLREKPGVSDKQFLYYFSISSEFRDVAILSMTGSSGRQRVQNEVVTNHSFFLPSLPEQKAIASVLSSLDDKIDLLRRQNKTLEAMAEALFRQWFVEDAQEDWEEEKLADYADHVKVNVTPANTPMQLYTHYSLPAFDEGMRPVVELGSAILSNKYGVEAWTILVSKLNPRFPRIWPIGDKPGENAICSTEFQGFKPKSEKLYGYLCFLLKSKDVTEKLTMAASGTSGSHQRVGPEDIKNIRIRIPSLARAEEYSEVIMPGIEKLLANLEQVRALEKLRGTLLPKLMSGEVRVDYARQDH